MARCRESRPAHRIPDSSRVGGEFVRPRSAAIIACRTIALFLGIEAAIQIIAFLLTVRSLEGTSFFWATFGARAVVSLVLWVVADRLGEAMARGTDDTASARPNADVMTIAFTIVGVVLVVQAIPALVELAMRDVPRFAGFAPLERSVSSSAVLFGDRTAEIVREITSLVIGVALIVSGRALAETLRRRMPQEGPEPG